MTSADPDFRTADPYLFHALANAIPQLAWIADGSGWISWYNDRWYDYTGTTLGEMQGWGWRSVHHPDHIDHVIASITRSFTTGEPWEDTFPLRRKDGSYRWFLSRAIPVRGTDGKVTHWFGTNTDVTEQRDTQESVRVRADFLARLMEGSTDCVKVLDLEGNLSSMTEAGLRLMDIDDFEIVKGLPWVNLWQGPHEADAHMAIASALRGEVGRFRGFAKTLKGTPRWWDVRVSAILGADGKPDHLLAISRDITAEYEAEQSVREMNTALQSQVADGRTALLASAQALSVEVKGREAAETQVRQLQKMEAVGQLAGGIAHDFNNMLAVVMGSLNLIQRRLAKGEDVTVFIEHALESVNKATALTHRLIAFSRQLPLAPEPTDVNRLVANMSEILRRTLGEDTPLETVLAGGLWKTNIDKSQLENALLNLAVNARDAMEGGKLTVETANSHLDAGYARAHEEVHEGQYVMVAVSDTGTGMTDEVLEKAFNPFFTTKEVGKGTGLGLSQVHGFVKQSGGHIKIYSEIGHGTTVKIYLPRHYPEAEALDKETALPPIPRGSLDQVVLVVEDNERMRDISAAGLRELGYSVFTASGAASALRILETHPEICLLFTDIVMPEINGRQFASAALKLRPDLKVIFTTGYTRNAIVHGGVLDHGVNFLAKPFSLDELGRKLNDVFGKPSDTG